MKRLVLSYVTSLTSERIAEILATVFIVISVYLTTRNVFPANIIFQFLGCVCWVYLGIKWKKWSLILMNVIFVLMDLNGFWRL